ncbi:hypothetical protein BDB01DRAFT_906897 [Pilobolus umbonatus]|nr:hypothetical protein BDB01DRAFT_906897 [Pilobolus umbonatus]
MNNLPIYNQGSPQHSLVYSPELQHILDLFQSPLIPHDYEMLRDLRQKCAEKREMYKRREIDAALKGKELDEKIKNIDLNLAYILQDASFHPMVATSSIGMMSPESGCDNLALDTNCSFQYDNTLLGTYDNESFSSSPTNHLLGTHSPLCSNVSESMLSSDDVPLFPAANEAIFGSTDSSLSSHATPNLTSHATPNLTTPSLSVNNTPRLSAQRSPHLSSQSVPCLSSQTSPGRPQAKVRGQRRTCEHESIVEFSNPTEERPGSPPVSHETVMNAIKAKIQRGGSISQPKRSPVIPNVQSNTFTFSFNTPQRIRPSSKRGCHKKSRSQ